MLHYRRTADAVPFFSFQIFRKENFHCFTITAPTPQTTAQENGRGTPLCRKFYILLFLFLFTKHYCNNRNSKRAPPHLAHIPSPSSHRPITACQYYANRLSFFSLTRAYLFTPYSPHRLTPPFSPSTSPALRFTHNSTITPHALPNRQRNSDEGSAGRRIEKRFVLTNIEISYII